MKKYWVIISNEIQRQLVHRFFIISFTGGNFLELLAQLVLWSAIFQSTDIVKGYTSAEMMSYLVFGWIFRFLTTSYGYENLIYKDIQSGKLSNFIVKPISYLRYITADSIGRVVIACSVIVLQAVVWIIFLHDKLTVSLSVGTVLLLVAFLVLSYFIKFFLSVLIGVVGMWTTEVSGVSYLSNVIVKLLSGAYFPMDLLPAGFVAVSFWFPFVYIFFVPMQLLIGKIDLWQGVQGLGVMLLWLVILYLLIKVVWKVGLKKYESVGI
ncbi:hypothetical protein EPO05_03085 [Patescibacteria group bacterium]|nr:MAG: hypothetical protein EPO05_03085 [Patescibacteria group bacterium]